MNHRAIAELSAELITRYYKNEPMPFLEHMDDDALWYGPAAGQFIRGREEMIRIWSGEKHSLTFTMGDLKTETIAAHSSSCNVMLSYPVVTHYPEGQHISVDQRLLLCWGDRRIVKEDGTMETEPRILVCHISNPHGKHDEDVIYPKHYDQVSAGRDVVPQKGERLHFHGEDRAEYFYHSDSILWIETSAGGKRSILHTRDEAPEILATVSELAAQYPHLYLRCHQSYLVNPHYIRSIRRFRVTLSDGTQLPIPEKKYTAFRDEAVRRQGR